jgi:hypothetical protein
MQYIAKVLGSKVAGARKLPVVRAWSKTSGSAERMCFDAALNAATPSSQKNTVPVPHFSITHHSAHTEPRMQCITLVLDALNSNGR